MGVLPAALLAACTAGADDPVARWQTVTDTLGDTVVVRTVGADDSLALVRLVAEQSIGEFEGAEQYTFGSVSQVLPTPTGGVFVWDNTSGDLRLYDSSGTFVRRVGAKGGGPGEYDGHNGMGVLPDGRLVLWDARHQRVNVYDARGEFVATWPAATSFFTSRSVVVDSAGRVHLWSQLDQPDAAQPSQERRQGFVRVAADGAGPRDSLPFPDIGTTGVTLRADATENGRVVGSVATSLPYAAQPSRQLSPHGYYVTTAGAPYAVLLHRPEGLLRIERDVPPVPVQAAEREEQEARVTWMMRRNDPAWRWNGPAIPHTKPPIQSLEVDADGRLWVARSTPGERISDAELDAPRDADPNRPPVTRWRAPRAYDVFAPDGRFLGHVPVPRGTSLLHMRGDRAWGVVRDSLDVPYVTRFRLAWP